MSTEKSDDILDERHEACNDDKVKHSQTNINIHEQKEGKPLKTETVKVPRVMFQLRDINKTMVKSWEEMFKDYGEHVQVSHGDIFKGAPAADALVSPANSFGFMDGGIDMVYTNHFGWQMQKRLQEVIREKYDGELLVGQAAIIPAFEEGTPEDDTHYDGCNEDKTIKYLISAPTMRVPMDVHDTANAFIAFRAIILAVQKHNLMVENETEKINSVLCPGLGTAVGLMPPKRCAHQMLQAYEVYELGKNKKIKCPSTLSLVWSHHSAMSGFK